MSSPATLEDAALQPKSAADLLLSPRFYLAFSLSERIAAGKAAGPAADRAPVAGKPDGNDLAARRYDRWRTQKPFGEGDLWQRRLDQAGLAAEEMLALLGESPEEVQARFPTRPDWLEEIALAYGDGGTTAPFPWPPDAQLQRCRFAPLIEPLIFRAVARLEGRVQAICAEYPAAPIRPHDNVRMLVAHLPDVFTQMLNRALVVELHVAGLEEELLGDTPEARFEDFLGKLRQKDYALAILERYPVLARQIVQRLGQWERAAAEFLLHLAQDAEEIRRVFFGGRELGFLAEIGGSASDSHRDGRGVFLLRFDGGEQEPLDLVYKPKSMALEVAFQELLGFLNRKGCEPPLREVGVLDRGDHGWMEMVHPRPCDTEDELRRFYRRQGIYIALLYFLDATDFHHENIMAIGEHPILIDLETLFQPWLNGRSLKEVEGQAGAPLRATVLRSNMLPDRWWGDKENRGVDLSGLTAQTGQMTPQPMLASTDGGTDRMRMERRRIEIPVSDNLARLRDREPVSALDYAADLEAGFCHLYDLMLAQRDALLAADGPYRRFADCEMRILFRTTASYGILLMESFHPHVLGNALERDRLFDRLWSAVPRRPFLEPLMSAELRDLNRCDLPLFATHPGSRDVWSWDDQRFVDLLEESGLERAESKLRAASPRDRERQLAVVRDSLDAVRLATRLAPRPAYPLTPRPFGIGPEELLEEARRVGWRLVDRAFVGRDEALWLTLDYREPNGWQLLPSGPDFYLGLPGVALVLGYLGHTLEEPAFTEVARKAIVAQRKQIESDASMVKGLGGFNGWGGIVYALTHLAVLWNDDSLFDEAEAYSRQLPELIAQDEFLDFIAGSAGLAVCLLTLAEHRPSEHLDRVIRLCGERLLAKAEAQTAGIGWRMPLAGDRALAGISHGAAGIALALLQLEAATGDERYRAAALGALEFERSLFQPAEGNWPDLREDEEEQGIEQSSGHFMLAWCHGAPGVGLARIAGLPWLDDAAIRGEIAVAVKTTLERGFGENHCLCHGDLGNLELIADYARLTGDEALLAEVHRRAGGIVDSIRRDGWLFGLPGNIETPGLMAGLAGIAYGLARLAHPELPSVLTLAPARQVLAGETA